MSLAKKRGVAVLNAIAMPTWKWPTLVGAFAGLLFPGAGWLWHWAPAVQWTGGILALLSVTTGLALAIYQRHSGKPK